MLKSECTPEEWAVFAAERRKKDAKKREAYNKKLVRGGLN